MKSRKSGNTEVLLGETGYAARRWSHPRRIIIKAEVVPPWMAGLFNRCLKPHLDQIAAYDGR